MAKDLNSDSGDQHGGKRQCVRTDENWKCRVNLAAAFQLMDGLGLNEGIDNHLSLLAPAKSGVGEVMLINAYGTHWSQVTASNLIGVDYETGNTVEGEGRIQKEALAIHQAVHKINPKVQCIMHTHQPYVSSLNCLQDPRLLMVHQNSCYFHDNIAYDLTYNGLIDAQKEGERVAQVMNDKEILFQSNHGVTAVGPTVAYTFGQLYYLERACMFQMMAMNTGRPLKEIPLEVVLKTRKANDEYSCDRFFDAMKDTLIAKGSKFNC